MNAMEHWKRAEKLLQQVDQWEISSSAQGKTILRSAELHFAMARYMFDQDRFHPVNRMREVQDT